MAGRVGLEPTCSYDYGTLTAYCHTIMRPPSIHIFNQPNKEASKVLDEK